MQKKMIIGVVVMLSLFCGCGLKENKESVATETYSGEDEKNILKEEYSEDIPENSEGLETEEIGDLETEESGDLETENYNGLIFSTEYTVKDYCQGCFIVSKNDDLLYGVLDMTGKEIIPIKYDNICFLNKGDIKKGKIDTLFFKTEYEDVQTVIDKTGEIIFETWLNSDIYYNGYAFGTGDEDSPYFREQSKMSDWIRFYKLDGTVLSELDCGENRALEVDFISKDYFFLKRTYEGDRGALSTDCILYNTDNQIIREWELGWFMGINSEDSTENHYVFKVLFEGSDGGGYYQYILDDSGNLQEDGKTEEAESEIRTADGERIIDYLGNNKEVKLYESNDTYKLVDYNGEPLYDERYFDYHAVADCYLLANEDNEACLIDRNGNKILDYGWIVWDGSDGRFNGTVIDSESFFSGDDGVCFAVGSDVYFFEIKE